MGKRKYGGRLTNIPGRGLTWVDKPPEVPYPTYDDALADLLPEYVDPEIARYVMNEFWDILGVSAAQRRAAMKKAWAKARRRFATLKKF